MSGTGMSRREASIAHLAKAHRVMAEQRAARREKVRLLVADGRTNEDIAATMGISVRTVSADRRHLGVPNPRGEHRLTVSQKRLALNLLEDGCPYGEVARTLGIPREAVRWRWPGYGVGPGRLLSAYHARLAEELGLGYERAKLRSVGTEGDSHEYIG